MRKKRFLFLNELWKLTKGDEHAFESMWDIGKSLNFSREETNLIVQFLNGQGLIKFQTISGGISVTHQGLVQIEEAVTNPENPSEYFPPINTINVNQMTNSQIQRNIENSQQDNVRTVDNLQNIIEFLYKAKEYTSKLNLSVIEEQNFAVDLSTIEAQLASNKPKISIIKKCLGSIKTILEGIVGNILATELLKLLSQIAI